MEDRLPAGYAITGGGVKKHNIRLVDSEVVISIWPDVGGRHDRHHGVPKKIGVDFRTQVIGIRPKNGAPLPLVNMSYVEGTTGPYPRASTGNPPEGYEVVAAGAIATNGASGMPSALREVYVVGPTDARSIARSSGVLSAQGQSATIRDYGYMRLIYITMSGATYKN